jgi:RNA polymerase sigma factor (sigma-70 family)
MGNPSMQAGDSESPAKSERLLVERCINGEKAAWESLFHHHQPRLLAIIEGYLGHRAECGDLNAEEIAATVWYSLVVGENARLRRYDPSRGAGLLTYLAALARREIWKRYRRVQNRHSRETRAARSETTKEDAAWCNLLLQEFLRTLTRREREFCVDYLLSTGDESGRPGISAQNVWQLRSRIMRKLCLFSEESPSSNHNKNDF